MNATLTAFVHEYLGETDADVRDVFASIIEEQMQRCQAKNLILITPPELEARTQAFVEKNQFNTLVLLCKVVGLKQEEEAAMRLLVLQEFIQAAYPDSSTYWMRPQEPQAVAKAFNYLVEYDLINASFVLSLHPSGDEVHREVQVKESSPLFFEEAVMRLGLRGEDPAFKKALLLVQRLAPHKQPILIQGETGTGKELFTRLVHEMGPQRNGPFVSLNCATLPETLAESILMGHTKGAFTGALKDSKGKFIQAHGGTLFLDEVAEMSMVVQAKLLRVIEDGFVDAIGSEKSEKVDISLVCATHRDLREAVRNGTFREDLYYRLKVGCIQLPPLRQRRMDIPAIAFHLLGLINAASGTHLSLSDDALVLLTQHAWPGNIRELRNTLQRSAIMCSTEVITAHDILIDDPLQAAEPTHLALPMIEEGFTLNEYIRDIRMHIIQDALKKTNGKQSEAAKLLGISPQALSQHVRK